ncbi:MAG TPA: hypothetical protein VJO35_05810 [Terriglobales bacterium]|nr:hypothetical protein [Terriglobales bacterium]
MKHSNKSAGQIAVIAFRSLGVLLVAVSTLFVSSCSRRKASTDQKVDLKKAANYLDAREQWWTNWPGSARDHGTFCVSCHTALPYALTRPVLREALAEQDQSRDESTLVDDVRKRVKLWSEVDPYYDGSGYDGKTAQSRGTESVLNALILAHDDSLDGKLSGDTLTAFSNMWAQQQRSGEQKGTWAWLQFDQEPWEANDSAYYGATLAAIAVGTAPGGYISRPDIQPNLAMLREYLIQKSSTQSTVNRVFLLWASTKLPGLLSSVEQKAIIDEVRGRQQGDGGWRLASITWRWNGWSAKSLLNMWVREDGTPLGGKSDGVATGLITYVFEEAGVPSNDSSLERGLNWLKTNQNTDDGSWPASSVNRRRSASSQTGKFMSDAATAFAVLALTADQNHSSAQAHSSTPKFSKTNHE